jgi:hypothetical protein
VISALCAGFVLAPSAAAEPPPSEVGFGAQPSLFPAKYAPNVHDYVVRCHDASVSVTGHAAGAWRLAIAGNPYRSGDFTDSVPLSAGQEFLIRVRQSGHSRVYHYYARCLPDAFPRYTFKRYAPVSPRFFSVDNDVVDPADRWAIIFDNHGVPIWFDHAPARGTKVLPSGNLVWANESTLGYEVHRLDGSLVRTLNAIGQPADFHDIQILGNGDYLVGVSFIQQHVDTSAYGGSSDANVWRAELQDVSPGGSLLWGWKSQNHISLGETPKDRWRWAVNNPFHGAYDITHWNSIEPDGDSVIASFRHLDAVYKIRKSTGNIVWKLGGTKTAKSLTVKGDPIAHTLGAQHDARLLPDGTLTVFDNRTNVSPKTPEALRFRIDEQRRTATLLQSITDPNVPVSNCCGSARRLANGDWLISWGKTEPVGGYEPDGTRTFSLAFEGAYAYRADPVPNGAVSASDLRQGMDAMYAGP